MPLTLADLSANDIRDAITRARDERLVIVGEGRMPEADVLMCRFHGQRVNLHVDLAYGAEVVPVDPLSADETDEITRLIGAYAIPCPTVVSALESIEPLFGTLMPATQVRQSPAALLRDALSHFETTGQQIAHFDVCLERVSPGTVIASFEARPIPGERAGLGNSNRLGRSVIYTVAAASGTVVREQWTR